VERREREAKKPGPKPLLGTTKTHAERQARYRDSHAEGEPKFRYRKPADRRSRPQRWRDAVTELLDYQVDYQHGSLPLLLFSKNDGHWRSSDDNEGVIGRDGRQDAANIWSTCYSTDRTFDKYQDLGDQNTGMQLLVWNNNSNVARTCEITLIP
jgi:hypothetical protein